MPATQEAVEDARCVNEVELVLLYSFGLAISAAKLVCGRVMLFSRCSDVFFFLRAVVQFRTRSKTKCSRSKQRLARRKIRSKIEDRSQMRRITVFALVACKCVLLGRCDSKACPSTILATRNCDVCFLIAAASGPSISFVIIVSHGWPLLSSSSSSSSVSSSSSYSPR